MKPTFNDRFIAWLALASGIAISGVAEFYSIMGLIAIYPAALIPIIVMGVVLGVGKLSATVWVKQNWEWSPAFLKVYILPAIALLMLITSVGVFGFLSKAHSDQSLVSGDVQAKIAVYDEKIKTERDNIDADRRALKQMDEAVDQVMARSTSENGAARSVDIRRSQQKERSRLAQDITTSQQRITALNEERAPIAAEVRKVEAEVGPIKYIAAFVYGANPDANILEKAVSWVSILIVIVLDPLAIVLLLASQYSFQRFREDSPEESSRPVKMDFEGVRMPNGEWVQTGPAFTYEPDDGPLTPEQVDALKEDAELHRPTGEILAQEHLFEKAEEFIKTWKANDRSVEGDSPIGPEVVIDPQPATVTKPPQPILSTEESRVVKMKVFPPPTKPEGYVQNEEQTESNIWSTTTTESTPLPDDEDHVIYLAANIRAGRMHMNEVPAELVNRVKARL
jgi:energy-converting hydrogenase Eha subunit A